MLFTIKVINIILIIFNYIYFLPHLMHNWHWVYIQYTRVNQKVKAIFKLRGNRDRQELVHCAVLTMPIKELSHVQYSALPSVKWQQRGRKHGRSFARLHHRRSMWRSAVSLCRRSETCGNSLSYVGSVWTEHHESTKGLWMGGKVYIRSNMLLMKVVLVGHQHHAAVKLLLRRNTETSWTI